MSAEFIKLVAEFEGLPAGISPEAAKAQAARLVAAYGSEAVNVALKCQDTLMSNGNELAALAVLQVITQIWDIEDGQSAA